MLASRSSIQRSLYRILCLFALVPLLAACQGASVSNVQVSSPTGASPSATPAPQYAEVTFQAELPSPLIEGQNLYIEILDEVTGLALNPARARMQSSNRQSFEIKIPIPLGSVIKYRYYRDNDPTGIEYTTANQQVRYRLYYVNAPGIVTDTVAAWRSQPSTAILGRIQGQVANKVSKAPVVNALVTAGGEQTLTASDGSFILEGLPPGVHNVVVYSMDGQFQPFQQGAVVASESTTPALVLLDSMNLVNVTFIVRPPADNPTGVPIRLIGNTYALGNTFADLAGGMSTVASRAPLMKVLPDGRYTLTLRLPSGLDLRYKYTLGDGFWNAERGAGGEISLRQLIVPANDITVEDQIATWKTSGFSPVTFDVTVPANTPATDTISIQFNPFGWTQPIPMWPTGNNHWFYVLYNPLNLFESASYRYCRNEQCGTADATDSQGSEAAGKVFQPKDTPQNMKDVVPSWSWMESLAEPVVISPSTIQPRGESFLAGVEFMTGYRPSWQPYLGWTYQSIKDIGGNTVMLTPTWHLTHNTPPVIAPVTGLDPMWFDLLQMTSQAQQQGLSVVIHPVLQYDEDPEDWWSSAVRDDGWWQTWFARYQTFLLYHADLAAQTGAKVLIIGDESLLPAFPGGLLANGDPSNVPFDAEKRWSDLIAAVRARYTGKIAWMLPENGSLPPMPDFLSNVDLLYVQISPPVAQADNLGQEDLELAVTTILDQDILHLQEKTNQPILLGLHYPSAQGSMDGCVGQENACIPLKNFDLPAVNVAGVSNGMKEQAQVYNALLAALNQRSWIAGLFADGYNPAVELKDNSVSVRGKPAGDILGYWYPRLLNQVTP